MYVCACKGGGEAELAILMLNHQNQVLHLITKRTSNTYCIPLGICSEIFIK